MTDFNRALDAQGLAAFRARFSDTRQAQIAPFLDSDVALDIDLPEMEAVLVGASGHVGGTAKRLVRIDRKVLHAYRAKAAWSRPSRLPQFPHASADRNVAVPSVPVSFASFN